LTNSEMVSSLLSSSWLNSRDLILMIVCHLIITLSGTLLVLGLCSANCLISIHCQSVIVVIFVKE